MIWTAAEAYKDRGYKYVEEILGPSRLGQGSPRQTNCNVVGSTTPTNAKMTEDPSIVLTATRMQICTGI